MSGGSEANAAARNRKRGQGTRRGRRSSSTTQATQIAMLLFDLLRAFGPAHPFNPACQLTTTCNGAPTAFLIGTRNLCPSGLTSYPTVTGANER